MRGCANGVRPSKGADEETAVQPPPARAEREYGARECGTRAEQNEMAAELNGVGAAASRRATDPTPAGATARRRERAG
jgi:hypothetical protein